MAFYVAQLRKQNGTGTYMTPVENIIATSIESPNPFQDATSATESKYLDFALQGNFEAGKVYYLRFKIHKIPQFYYSGTTELGNETHNFSQADLLNIRLLLKNNLQEDEEKNPPEQVGTFTVPQALSQEPDAFAFYSFVFTPSKTFDRLVFRIIRTGYDELIAPRNWLIEQLDNNFNPVTTIEKQVVNQAKQKITVKVKGVRINYGNSVSGVETGENGDLCVLNNILTLSETQKYWIKFGYQSRPGNLIVVNGEPIRVGRSGIYQINNGTKITSFMVASPNGSDNANIDAFLLDYAYTG